MQRLIIKPNLVGDLTFANAASARFTKYRLTLVTLGKCRDFRHRDPPNTTAKAFIPADRVENVREGSGLAPEAPGI
jgi:hypothetical protein